MAVHFDGHCQKCNREVRVVAVLLLLLLGLAFVHGLERGFRVIEVFFVCKGRRKRS